MVDYHVHTDHSGDGRTPVDAMVQTAITKGLSEICITSHYDVDAPVGNRFNFNLDFPVYVADVQRCAKTYADRIAVKLGVEAGLQADKPQVIQTATKSIRSWPFDFVIASTHFLRDPDYHRPTNWIDVKKGQVQALYLNHTLQYLEKFNDFDVIAHLTYFSRYSPSATKAEREMTYDDNRELYDRLFEILVQRGKGIEINTSVKSTQDLFIPDYSIAKRFYELGGRIVTIGSDAHVPQQIGAYYHEALQMLREAGFKAICRFDKRKPIFMNI